MASSSFSAFSFRNKKKEKLQGGSSPMPVSMEPIPPIDRGPDGYFYPGETRHHSTRLIDDDWVTLESSFAEISDSPSLKSLSGSIVRQPRLRNVNSSRTFDNRIIRELVHSPNIRISYGSLHSQQTSLYSISSNTYEHPAPLPSNHINPFVATPPFSTQRFRTRSLHDSSLAENLVGNDLPFGNQEGFIRIPIRAHQLREQLGDTSWKEERDSHSKFSFITKDSKSFSSLGWLSPIPRSESQTRSVFAMSSPDDRCMGIVAKGKATKLCGSYKSSLGSWDGNDEGGPERTIVDVDDFFRHKPIRTGTASDSTPTKASDKSSGGDGVIKVGERLHRHTVHGSLESVKAFDSDGFYERIDNHPIHRGEPVFNIENELVQSMPNALSERYGYTQRFVEPLPLPTMPPTMLLPHRPSPLAPPTQLPRPKVQTPLHPNVVGEPRELEISNLTVPEACRSSHKRTNIHHHQLENIMGPMSDSGVTFTPGASKWKYRTSAQGLLVTKVYITSEEEKRNRLTSVLGCLCISTSCFLLPAYGWGGLDSAMNWISDGKWEAFHERDKRWAQTSTFVVVGLTFCGLVALLIRHLCH